MRDFDPTAGEFAGVWLAPKRSTFDPKHAPLRDFGAITGPLLGGVASSVVGGLLGDNAASNAADAQTAATDQSNATQRYFYDTTRNDNMPALQARNNALARMQQLLGVGGDNGSGGYGSANGTGSAQDVMNTPGYQFGLDQGTTALNRQAAARGAYNSGAALKAASRYGTDYATTKYQDAFNNLQTQQTNALNRLAQVAGYGTTGANTIASSGANAGNNISANQTALGNALGAAQLSSSNGWTSALNGAASAIRNYSGNGWSGSNSNALAGSGWTGGANAYGYLPDGSYVGGMS